MKWGKDRPQLETWLQRIAPHPRIVGSTPGQSYYLDPRRVIYDHELLLFAKGGSFEVVFNEERYELGSNSFIIIPPGRWHVSRGIESENVKRAWIHFDWIYDPRPVPELDLTYAPAEPEQNKYHYAPEFMPSAVMHGKIHNPQQIFSLQQRIQERFNTSQRASTRALVLELLLELLDPEGHSGAQNNVQISHALEIRNALDKIAHMPFDQAPAVREYLDDRGQSYDHQARIFKKAYAVTPLQYINALRIEQACNLLRDTSLTVSAIAEQLGYNDAVYFGRSFKKYSGLTPQGFRRQG
ncbi:MAG: helix-turn-helix transcriptional regulator [Planctomycetes bacterium]|nr:helix-turn-helix transcriptional regulator [Planctomycetota bacterium]